MRPWLAYTLARLGFFVVALAILLLLHFDWVFGAIIATVIAFALSMFFLSGLRQRVADDIRRRVEKPEKDGDSDAEDRQIDAPKR